MVRDEKMTAVRTGHILAVYRYKRGIYLSKARSDENLANNR